MSKSYHQPEQMLNCGSQVQTHRQLHEYTNITNTEEKLTENTIRGPADPLKQNETNP